ncbi:lytic transglycosylase domain-containing protein [Candidatus Woesearchaeota archaeon]|nr:lytic transglycosylase domain-containing protein [Candidatus Woesearchaeota archaeon]
MMGIDALATALLEQAEKPTRRDMLRFGLGAFGTLAFAALPSCTFLEKQYDLVYGFSNDPEDLYNLKEILGSLLNIDKNLKIIRTGKGDYALIHDIDRSKNKAEELANLYTVILREHKFLGPADHAVVIESGLLEREVEEVPERREVPFGLETMTARKRRALHLMVRAVDQLISEHFLVARDHIPLFMAMTEAESSFSAELIRTDGFGEGSFGDISYAGAVGYMQLMPTSVPKELVIRREDLRLSPTVSNTEYARALVEFCRNKPLDELRKIDVRFDPYKNIYYGIREIMELLNGKFRPGGHTYYSYPAIINGKQRTLGAEWNPEKPPRNYVKRHTVNITPLDSRIYSLAGYNWGAYATMGFITRHNITSGEQFLDTLEDSSTIGTRIVHYIRKIVRRTEDYQRLIPQLT